MEDKTVGIYIHIPFCASKCAYCDFCSLAGRDRLMPAYQDALLRHIREFAPRLDGCYIDTVYFGGGTPSYYGAKQLIAVFDVLKRNYKVLKESEVTFEANPESIDEDELCQLRRVGFNRISIGAQTANDSTLKTLGRVHNFEQVQDAVETAKRAGFDNISLDLMYGLPRQTREDWADTLVRSALLGPAHISCYGLKLEESVPMYMYKDGPDIPDDDAQADMYLYAVETLQAMGFAQYEISNFAMKGKESAHNLKYWCLNEYAGFGASASSYIGSRRYSYTRDVEQYIAAVKNGGSLVAESEDITNYERASEYIMLSMRTTRGIHKDEYLEIYKSSFDPIEELLRTYAKLGFTKCLNERWSFTPQGFLISNRLIGELLDAQAGQKLLVGTPWRDDDYYYTLL